MVNGHLLVPSTIQSLLANGTGNSVLSSSTSGKVSKRQPGTQWRLMMYGSCPQSMIHMFERVLLNVYDRVSFHSKSVFIVVLHYLFKKHTRHIVKVFEQKGHSKVNKRGLSPRMTTQIVGCVSFKNFTESEGSHSSVYCGGATQPVMSQVNHTFYY